MLSNEMHKSSTDLLETFAKKLADKQVTHLWFGFGSSLFIELGELTSYQRRDGSDGPPMGEMGIMIEQDWRLEGRKSILCGSSSNDHFFKSGIPATQHSNNRIRLRTR